MASVGKSVGATARGRKTNWGLWAWSSMPSSCGTPDTWTPLSATSGRPVSKPTPKTWRGFHLSASVTSTCWGGTRSICRNQLRRANSGRCGIRHRSRNSREPLNTVFCSIATRRPACAGRLAPTARTSWRTRVAEDRRGRDVAKKPSAVAGTAQSGSIRRPEQQGKGYRTWQKCENRCIAAADRLPCPCHEGQNGNPG